jgi:putative CocE/NonD family hydrolase
MKKFCLLILIVLSLKPGLFSQQVLFHQVQVSDSTVLAKAMPSLAHDIITRYRPDSDENLYFGNLFMLQMVAGDYTRAISSIRALRTLNKASKTKYPDRIAIQYEIFCKAKLMEESGKQSFREAFDESFKEVFGNINDKEALYISTAFMTRSGLDDLKKSLAASLNLVKDDSLDLINGINLCRNYNLFRVFKIIEPLAQPLLAKDDEDRYIIEDSVLIKTRDGAYISAWVARTREITGPRSTILQFSIYARPFPVGISRLKDPVANGYVSVVAYTRGKGNSPDEVFPYEHDGQDVNDVIEWITKQPWSNGKVGMFGGSYNGFAQWASTKNLHPALKTIVPSASAAPGLDVPMTNNVVMSFVFPWIYYVSNNKYLDDGDYNNTALWDSVNTRWYSLGKPYRLLDSITGRGTNKIFQRWLDHPAYDKYWQDMIPYKEEFGKINIPVLTTTGYYDGGQIGAMYYYREHLHYNKNAVHYLLIGPYGHYGSQSVPDRVYNGYRIDPVANISIHDIIYQWFDYILKDSVKPAILKDKVNFEVMGSNVWKHVPTLDSMADQMITLYLSDNRSEAKGYKLSEEKPAQNNYLLQKVNFADRSTINNYDRENRILYDSLDTGNGITFISSPVQEEISIAGAFTGELKAEINKMDMDFSLVLYELMPDGRYFYLSYFMGRASYAKDKSNRQLLKPGQIESIPFWNSYITGKKLSIGSRLVIVLNINKSPNEQINYGTGKNVSDESILDAQTPLQVKWYNNSYVRIPIRKQVSGE